MSCRCEQQTQVTNEVNPSGGKHTQWKEVKQHSEDFKIKQETLGIMRE